MDLQKEYTNGEVTVVWKPKLCFHSAVCVNGLPNVFKPKEKPWINIDSVNSDQLISQIKECPSGALTYYLNNQEEKMDQNLEVKAQIVANGPILVKGPISITHSNGDVEQKEQVAFCRCGASANKPFCDGKHKVEGFVG